MFFYLIVIPALLLISIQIVKIYFLSKHDRVLYGFCQLRREIIAFLRKVGNKQFENMEKKTILPMLNIVNDSIHYFPIHKKEAFHVQVRFVRSANEVADFAKKEVQTVQSYLQQTENKEIRSLQIKFILNMLYAGFAYTPFIRLKLLIWRITLKFQPHKDSRNNEQKPDPCNDNDSNDNDSNDNDNRPAQQKSSLKWLERQIPKIPMYEKQLLSLG